jgi:NAD-dependent DNA ligase
MKSKTKDKDELADTVAEILDSPDKYARGATIIKLVDVLKKLSDYYYNTGESLISDEIYDILKDVLEERDPTNKYLAEIGAPIVKSKDKVKLPYFMPSLDKIKPESDALDKWKKKYKGPYTLSDKLDGVSGLLIKKNDGNTKLYTRGDGVKGQDISYLLPHIISTKGNKLKNIPKGTAIRGELIISKKDFKKISGELKNARNAVAGLVNSKTVPMNVAKITTFIGYSVIYPIYDHKTQLEKIKEWNLHSVHYKNVEKIDDLTNDNLSEYLKERRNDSTYEIDGIVVTDSSKAYTLAENKNPLHSFAFKTVLTDQIAEVTVLDVEWNISKDGYLKPRVKVTPVDLSGVTIEYATAFNGKFVEDNVLGPGAVIKLIRSGDVIPHIMEVLKPSASSKPKMPDVPYKWTKTGVDILSKDMNGKQKDSLVIKQLTYFFKTLGVKFISEGIITKLVENGYDTLVKILEAGDTVEDLYDIDGIGDKLVDKIYNNVDNAFKTTTLERLMAASGIFGRGFGVRKNKLITTAYPNIMRQKWANDRDKLFDKIMEIEGFDTITATQFADNFKKFKKFFHILDKLVDIKHLKTIKKKSKKDSKKNKLEGKKIVFTGFRDADLEQKIEDNDGKITGSVSNNTDILIYANTDVAKDTSKYKKAKTLGIKMMTVDAFKKLYI